MTNTTGAPMTITNLEFLGWFQNFKVDAGVPGGP